MPDATPVEPTLHGQLAELLASAGWHGSGDTPTLALRQILPKIQALLAPTGEPAGGPAFPVDPQMAHTIAFVAVAHLPEGSAERELAYLLAKARAGAGMGLRDWYAGQALAGLCANPGGPFQAVPSHGWAIMNCTFRDVADECFHLADAMLEARPRG